MEMDRGIEYHTLGGGSELSKYLCVFGPEDFFSLVILTVWSVQKQHIQAAFQFVNMTIMFLY